MTGKAAGFAKVTVTDRSGRVIGRDAVQITEAHVLSSLRLPVQVGGLFSSREFVIEIVFDPPVKP